MRKPHLLGFDPDNLAGLMDFYEVTMADSNHVAGIAGRRSVFNAAVRGLRDHKLVSESEFTSDGHSIVIDGRRIGLKDYDAQLDGKTYHLEEFEPDNYLLNMGLEQILGFVSGWQMNEDLLGVFSKRGLSHKTIDALTGATLDLTIDAIPEGIPIFGHEPYVSVEGSFEKDQFPESLILGTWGYQTAIATNASYIVNMLEEFGRSDVITLEGGSRRCYPGGALAATRAALAAGFKGTSLTEIARVYPELVYRIGGSSGHSAILHIGSDFEAFELQLKAYYDLKPEDSDAVIREKISKTPGIGPTDLIDTFESSAGLEAAIKVMQKYGIESQIRNDSGDPFERLPYIRSRLDMTRPNTRIMVSDDLKSWKIYDMLKAGIPFDTLLIGTYLVNPRFLPGPAYKLSADQVSDSDANMALRCKVSANNPAKGTLPGQLDVYRIIDREGYARKDVVLLRGVDSIDNFIEKSDQDYIKLNQRVMENGEMTYDLPDMCQIIENTKYHMGLLRPVVKRFRGAESYEVQISNTVKRAQENIAGKFGQGRMCVDQYGNKST